MDNEACHLYETVLNDGQSYMVHFSLETNLDIYARLMRNIAFSEGRVIAS